MSSSSEMPTPVSFTEMVTRPSRYRIATEIRPRRVNLIAVVVRVCACVRVYVLWVHACVCGVEVPRESRPLPLILTRPDTTRPHTSVIVLCARVCVHMGASVCGTSSF